MVFRSRWRDELDLLGQRASKLLARVIVSSLLAWLNAVELKTPGDVGIAFVVGFAAYWLNKR